MHILIVAAFVSFRTDEEGNDVARRPLLKGVAPPLRDRQRLDMLQKAIDTIAERRDLDPRLQARGIAPLAFAAKQLADRLNGANGRRREKN